MKTNAKETLVIGDDVKDIKTAKSAGAISVATLWGAKNVDELIDVIENRFEIK